ncbi:MAG TPA: flagellar biosynthetic protein FliR [Gemmatimonadales bacterium]|nr:flagellar biosynthetic protein FliR [Gemmatimonadales bacterium]
MSEAIVSLLGPVNWPLFALVSARVVGLMMMAPLWSMQAIPARIRGAAAVVLTLMLLPAAAAAPVDLGGPLPMPLLLIEFLIGLAIGITAAVFLHGLTIAAEVLGLQMGLSLGAALGGMTEMGTPGIGQLYAQTALVIFATLGGHVILVTALGGSLAALPPGAALDLVDGGRTLIGMIGSVFGVAVRVAAPVMVALLVTNLALALLNRAVPQLNTMMVAVPITIAVGLVAIGSTLLLFGAEAARWVEGLDDGVAALVGALRPVPAGGP